MKRRTQNIRYLQNEAENDEDKQKEDNEKEAYYNN